MHNTCARFPDTYTMMMVIMTLVPPPSVHTHTHTHRHMHAVIICDLVNPIPNGDSRSSRSPIRGPGGSQGFGVGTVVTYTCGTNFELRGESTRTCLDSGEWDRPEPFCEPGPGEQHS